MKGKCFCCRQKQTWQLHKQIGCLQTRDSDDARNAAGGQEVIFLHRNHQQKLKMPVFCIVYECSNRSNGENTRTFYRVQTCVVHKGEKSRN